MEWKMLTGYLRRRAIRDYLRQLLFLVRQDHGINAVDDFYTLEQVMLTLRRHGLNTHFERYAIAMFCSQEACEAQSRHRGWPESYASMRTEIEAVQTDMVARSRAAPGTAMFVAASLSTDTSSIHGCHDGSQSNSCDHGGS